MSEQTLSPRETRAVDVPAPARRSIWSLLLGNLWMTLGGLTGVMQAVAIQWWLVVVQGGAGFGAFGMGVLSFVLFSANVIALPMLRRARVAGGLGRQAARLYIALGIMTLLVGLAISTSWLGLALLGQLASWLGYADLGFSLALRICSMLVVFAVAAMVSWAFTGGQKFVDRSRVKIPIAGLHEDHRGLQVGHLTDLHIGNGLEGDRLSKMVADANALDADLIVLTGDIFDFDPAYVEDGAKRLGDLSARLGVYAVLGNHDTYTGTDTVVAAFAEHAPGVRLLRDEWMPLPVEQPLYIAGIEDPGRGWTTRNLELASMDDLSASLPDDGPALLLVHRPQAFEQAARLGFPLVLAGHTHGGQMALPLPGGHYNLALVMTGFTRGLYQIEDSVMYVNRGIGVAGPAVRFNCRREMAMVELA